MTAIRVAWRSPWAQAAFVVLLVLLALTVLWWRGPDWGAVWDAFRFVVWSWIVLAFALNVVSTLFRALSWRMTISQALPAEHQPKAVHVFSAFGVGLFANVIIPGASASSRASRRFAGTCRTRLRARARRSSGRCSRTGSSISSRRRCSSSGCS